MTWPAMSERSESNGGGGNRTGYGIFGELWGRQPTRRRIRRTIGRIWPRRTDSINRTYLGHAVAYKMTDTAMNELPELAAAAAPPPEQSAMMRFLTQDYLLGSWGGLRPYLSAHGVDFEFFYIASNPRNISGGIATGSAYEGAMLMMLDLDSQKLAGYPGGHFHIGGVSLHGEDQIASQGSQMIVLDKDAIVESQAMIGSTPLPHCILFQKTPARRGFTRVQNCHGQTGDCVDIAACEGSHAAQSLQKIEGHALGGQHAAQ